MSSLGNTCAPRSDTTPEQARDARAHAWTFVFRCWHEKEKPAPSSRPEDAAKEIKNGCDAEPIIPSR